MGQPIIKRDDWLADYINSMFLRPVWRKPRLTKTFRETRTTSEATPTPMTSDVPENAHKEPSTKVPDGRDWILAERDAYRHELKVASLRGESPRTGSEWQPSDNVDEELRELLSRLATRWTDLEVAGVVRLSPSRVRSFIMGSDEDISPYTAHIVGSIILWHKSAPRKMAFELVTEIAMAQGGRREHEPPKPIMLTSYLFSLLVMRPPKPVPRRVTPSRRSLATERASKPPRTE